MIDAETIEDIRDEAKKEAFEFWARNPMVIKKALRDNEPQFQRFDFACRDMKLTVLPDDRDAAYSAFHDSFYMELEFLEQ